VGRKVPQYRETIELRRLDVRQTSRIPALRQLRAIQTLTESDASLDKNLNSLRPDVETVSPLRPRIGLALSGGGFRASVFHLGVIRRLAELGWLPHIDMISTVSGGSILGAFMSLRWTDVLNHGADWSAFDLYVAQPFLNAVAERDFIRDWLLRSPTGLFRKPFDRSYTRTKLFAEMLGKRFFSEATCSNLPSTPYLVLNATNLLSMRAWRFTKHGMGDSRWAMRAGRAGRFRLESA
jgi:predicted acylesterase/phospholipase RssA